jgi:hypothetical protein
MTGAVPNHLSHRPTSNAALQFSVFVVVCVVVLLRIRIKSETNKKTEDCFDRVPLIFVFYFFNSISNTVVFTWCERCTCVSFLGYFDQYDRRQNRVFSICEYSRKLTDTGYSKINKFSVYFTVFKCTCTFKNPFHFQTCPTTTQTCCAPPCVLRPHQTKTVLPIDCRKKIPKQHIRTGVYTHVNTPSNNQQRNYLPHVKQMPRVCSFVFNQF